MSEIESAEEFAQLVLRRVALGFSTEPTLAEMVRARDAAIRAEQSQRIAELEAAVLTLDQIAECVGPECELCIEGLQKTRPTVSSCLVALEGGRR